MKKKQENSSVIKAGGKEDRQLASGGLCENV